MRILAPILAFYILILAIKPGIEVLARRTDTQQTCCRESCTPVSEKPTQQNQDNGCDGKSCNPFQVCCAYVLICMHLPITEASGLITLTEKQFPYASAFTAHYAADFWKPPKAVSPKPSPPYSTSIG